MADPARNATARAGVRGTLLASAKREERHHPKGWWAFRGLIHVGLADEDGKAVCQPQFPLLLAMY